MGFNIILKYCISSRNFFPVINELHNYFFDAHLAIHTLSFVHNLVYVGNKYQSITIIIAEHNSF